MSKREEGVFSYIKVEDYRGEGDKPNTVSVGIKFGSSGQGWGGLYLPTKKEQQLYLKMLCETFGVKDAEALKGMAVIALRNFDGWNEPIAGVENPKTGARFTTNKFRVAMGYPGVNTSGLEQARTQLQNRIASARRNIIDAEAELASLESRYTEWD